MQAAVAWRSWPLWFGKFTALRKVTNTVFPHGRVDQHVAAAKRAVEQMRGRSSAAR
jgi:hypothetical protein